MDAACIGSSISALPTVSNIVISGSKNLLNGIQIAKAEALSNFIYNTFVLFLIWSLSLWFYLLSEYTCSHRTEDTKIQGLGSVGQYFCPCALYLSLI